MNAASFKLFYNHCFGGTHYKLKMHLTNQQGYRRISALIITCIKSTRWPWSTLGFLKSPSFGVISLFFSQLTFSLQLVFFVKFAFKSKWF